MPRTVAALFVSLGLVISLGGSAASAQRDASSARSGAAAAQNRFVGTWKLVGVERRDANGRVVPQPAGSTSASRDGYIIYDQAGYMAVSIMPRDRPRYAGRRPTDEESLATIAGYAAYFGTFTVDEGQGVVTHHLEGSLNPGMGRDQKRSFTFSGNRLMLRPPANADGVQSQLTWERMPDLPNLTATQKRFLGFWKLLSYQRHNQEGEPVLDPPYSGYIIYTPAGFMMVHMMQPDRQPYAAAQPTPDEARQTARTYINYFGPFYVHEADSYVVHDQVGTLGLGRNGPSPQQRFYEFVDNRLLLHPPRTALPNGREVQDTVEWQRTDVDRSK